MIDNEGNVCQEEYGANVTVTVAELLDTSDIGDVWASTKETRKRIRKRTRRKNKR